MIFFSFFQAAYNDCWERETRLVHCKLLVGKWISEACYIWNIIFCHLNMWRPELSPFYQCKGRNISRSQMLLIWCGLECNLDQTYPCKWVKVFLIRCLQRKSGDHISRWGWGAHNTGVFPTTKAQHYLGRLSTSPPPPRSSLSDTIIHLWMAQT